eukprot:m.542470 g.542470  ORF g.542470 m.542470 type:complete len:51 (-) comp22119_c0_seq8:520-672(-)
MHLSRAISTKTNTQKTTPITNADLQRARGTFEPRVLNGDTGTMLGTQCAP